MPVMPIVTDPKLQDTWWVRRCGYPLRICPSSFCHNGPPWLPLLDQSASTRNESWEIMGHEGYSRPILQIGQKKGTFVDRI
ncbi:hypothetical protein CHARACLAT_032466 [Characodon lateralis]|uniref:Uncharacterized protein n=1 Tax=Characodon lateralis TaxID=208331 RepID=A0ABU7E019_9TELE|nr:hypothetical protein [Characodon lateralis]